MPKLAYKNCRGCKKSSTEVGELSHTRLCAECGAANLRENVFGLVSHSGPAFTRWRQGMAACVGLTLLDDTAASSHTHADG